MPAAQALHAVLSALSAAAAVRCLPATQLMHVSWPGESWYCPCAHAVHAAGSVLDAAESVRNLPVAHLLQASCAG